MERIELDHLVDEIVKKLSVTENIDKKTAGRPIPIGVSARHCHLSKEDFAKIFGKEGSLTKKGDLLQPDQFAANETVAIAGPKGSIEKVRVLGPFRKHTQVEVSISDSVKLGLKPPIRESGNIANSSPVTIIGPKGSIYLEEGLIIAQAHIHMSPSDAARFRVQDGDFVRVKINNERRPISFEKVKVRESPHYVLEMHIDTDEANAANVISGDFAELIRTSDVI
ncbi:phosphate propanoyltransferase [Bacillus sp. V5-8f]|uniref:phosphate propanoyltransferase n=1 Tax=Bacillus sp. V5-8f TaxID=2053044 RepID=UPI000C767D3D|nr:phosphate propanoyltransferase [Bacillus sp. V5-8f]PLT32700.1 propanediol utilization protein [Bacillus sp. V5-8f]